jgi:hypothetical protein
MKTKKVSDLAAFRCSSFIQKLLPESTSALQSLETVLSLLIGFTLTTFTVSFREEGESQGIFFVPSCLLSSYLST